MGGPKTKTSRKGKKAWRKNIDASEVIADQQQHQQHWQTCFVCCMHSHTGVPLKKD
jgi:hypothetical protein